MKKLIWLLPVLVGGILIFYFRYNYETCVNLNSIEINLEGDSQILIGYSEVKNDLLYLSLSFQNDATVLNVLGKESGLVCSGFSYGNYLNDSLLLVFDQEQGPFFLNSKGSEIDSMKSSIDFKGLEIADIKIGKFKGEDGVLVNNGDSLIFYNTSTHMADNLFSLNKLTEKYESIESFDLYGNMVVVILRRECLEGGCNYDYFLVNTEDNSFKSIFNLEEIKSLSYPPMVRFLSPSTYVTGYSDDQAYIAKNSIDGINKKKWCLGDLEIFNLETIQGEVYLTVVDEQIRKTAADKNPLKNLYSGVKVVSVGKLP